MVRVPLVSRFFSLLFRVIGIGLTLFVVASWLGPVLFPDQLTNISHTLDRIPEHERPLVKQLDDLELLLREERLTEAKAHMDEVIELAGRLASVSDRVKARLYLAKGELHWQSWQYIDAEQAWDVALELAQNPERYEDARNRIQRVKKIIEELNAERDSVDFYEAAPNIGPAGTPSGHVVIAQIYLVDRDSTGWGLPQRQFVETSNQRVEAWLQNAVADYNKQVRFSRRSFVIDRDPNLKRLRIGGSKRRYINSEVAAYKAVQFLGYDSIEVFLQKLMTDENADHAVLLYHVNRDDRSFTLPCMKRCRWQTEYAFIYEQARRKRWQSMEYAQAHETLHLFGADDLYRVSGAKRFATHDIMNYFSRNITDSTIEPITAYAVGLIADKPEVPFRVVNYAH